MSLKSAFHFILAIAFLFAALGGITLATPTQSDSLVLVQGARIQSVMTCLGCSGNGGGPG